MKKILSIVGARPQFIKHAAVEKTLSSHYAMPTIHTGQHFDENMSTIFFEELKMNRPTYMLKLGGGGHGEQTGKMMLEIEPIAISENPDAILVYGDTNSTLAGALVASKLNIPIIHIEAGLRSFNRSMPEEINRIVTDHLSTYLFTSTKDGINNLSNEGIEKNVFYVGDVMCDILLLSKKFVIKPLEFEFYYATLHRPYNTDNIKRLCYVIENLNRLEKKVIFSLHPRTKNMIERNNIKLELFKNILFIDPLSYIDNLSFLNYCSGLVTDSGGMQKEAYILKKKCVTVRTETEWVETLKDGWNELLFDQLENLDLALKNMPIQHNGFLYGSGKASSEILDILKLKI